VIRLVRLWSGEDGRSHVEESHVDLAAVDGSAVSSFLRATGVRFEESAPHSALDWHDAPRRQYVITLSGTLRFTTRDGETFTLAPGDVLLAEDTAGGGHSWRLVDDQPWRRAYVTLD
jgi:Cupin domain